MDAAVPHRRPLPVLAEKAPRLDTMSREHPASSVRRWWCSDDPRQRRRVRGGDAAPATTTRSQGIAKPKVLLVDDHRGMLDRVSALLAGDFDIAAVATDGSQAVDVASRVGPDVIVLDVNMPGLDGFDTKRALDQAGSASAGRVPEHGRCRRPHRRSVPVRRTRLCHQVTRRARPVGRARPGSHGRVFVPSLTSLFALTDGGGHAMQLHRGLERFLDGLAAFCGHSLRRGDAMCVNATADVREGLEHRLRAAGWAVGGPSRHRRYRAFDAGAALSRIMRDGVPDPAVLAEIASSWITSVSPPAKARASV